MAKGTRICKVCGKEYEYCKTWVSANKFRWQDVACSPECGAIYFKQIEESRASATDEPAVTRRKTVKKAAKKAEVKIEAEVQDIEPDSSTAE